LHRRRPKIVDAMAQAAKVKQSDEANSPSFSAAGSLQKFIQQVGEYPRRLGQFFHDVRVETRQVNWPTPQDVRSTTLVVIVTVTFFGAFFFVTDRTVSYFIQHLLAYFK
jgi:preprotein translocase subunit SecE